MFDAEKSRAWRVFARITCLSDKQMPPSHHPSSHLLADFLHGAISPGTTFLIARHLEACPRCVSQIQSAGPVALSNFGVPDEKVTLASDAVLTLIVGVSGLGEVVYQLEVKPGQLVPLNAPFLAEELLVLQGGAHGGGASYLPGDFLTLTETPEMRLVSDPASGCVCIIAAGDPSGLAAERLGRV